ncbi:MAG TPA: NAD(P)H-hydrate dehydratase, partial [Longimicrobium sp.]|nr:NAD(P)H-hydrate dehydratase [Longimicrobium sp.]
MRAWDRRAIDESGVPEPVLMEAAGRAAAAVVQSLHPEGHVVVFAGSGNNGGDGAVVARTLHAWGRGVTLVAVGSRPPDASLLHGWSVPTVGFDEFRESPAPASVYVDALLGTGSTGAPRAPYDGAVAWMNGEGKPVVALDGPSGIDFTTGAAAGPAVRADVTVTFGAPKRGLLLHPGRWHAGRIVAVEIGFPPLGHALGAQLITPAWAGRLPPVAPNAHKGQQGRVVIVAGRPGMAGASVLAGSGALRAGAGMCVLVAPDANRAILQASLPEALYEDRSRVEDEVLAAADAVVAGPGMGTDERSLVLLRRVIAAADAPLVFDADATTLLAQFPSLREEIRWPLLLTPHPGEMGRLLGRETADVVRDPFGAAAEAAERYRCTVLLKGSPSVVAEAGRPTLVNVAGHSGIATGGMGDVLSGIVGALLAVRQDARTAAGLGLYFAGRAAEIAGRGRGLLPRDVAEALPDALMETAPRESDLHLPGIVLDLPAPY